MVDHGRKLMDDNAEVWNGQECFLMAVTHQVMVGFPVIMAWDIKPNEYPGGHDPYTTNNNWQ